MQIVIEIPDETYEYILNGSETSIDEGNVVEAIRNGTPLPKGHGRLITEPTESEIAVTIGGKNDFAECIRDSVKAVSNNAKTIIQADKEGR